MSHTYGGDLAAVHDSGFGEFAASVAPEIVELLRGRGVRRGTIVDAGCGSGISSAIFSAAGYDVLGVDSSAAMIRLARRHAPDARFRTGSIFETRLPSASAVVALGEVLNYTTAPAGEHARVVSRFFETVHACLEPAGTFVFDVALWRERMTVEERSWYDGDGWIVNVERFIDRPNRVLTRRIITIRRKGRSWRVSEERHDIALFERSELTGMLRAAGFRFVTRPTYARFELPPHHAVFIATAVKGARARGSGRR